MGAPDIERTSVGEIRVPRDRILHDWPGAFERARLYLEALGVEPVTRSRLASLAVERAITSASWDEGSGAVGETMSELRRLVRESYPAPGRSSGETGDPFEAWRLEAALAGGLPADAPAPAGPLRLGDRICSAPPLSRKSMPPTGFKRRLIRSSIVRTGNHAPGNGDPKRGEPGTAEPGGGPADRRKSPWSRAALRRRVLLALLVLIPSFVASQFMLEVLPYQGRGPLEAAIVLSFAILFGWISIGFWTALAGFLTLVRRKDPFAVSAEAGEKAGEIDPAVRTAILMPICDEPVERVMAGLKVIRRSLDRTGAGRSFDVFILSDSRDPSNWVREEEAWFSWCREEAGFERTFYRRRRVHVKRKSGNIAEFCRGWGRNYRYMIVLDADSVMAGQAIVRLVRMMEARPDAGMIQTYPVAVNRRSLFARLQQFTNRLYGPLFAAGLHYWQLGDGQYWGHNAIIRVAPFMEHCFLPNLPGRPPLGGEILSHDFVEAALMGRAGWTIWLAYDLPGSYEETSSSLLGEMRRDRRWCQGNLQHLKLVFTRGLAGAHRALFFHGALSYVSAALWFGFLSLSTAEAVLEAVRGPRYFSSGPTLFPEWPIWRPRWALSLAIVTGVILFLPKFLAPALAIARGEAGRFGGPVRMSASVALEILLSALLAPIRMMFHGRFVASTFLGRVVTWDRQSRDDDETSWGEALRRHGLDMAVATTWGLGAYWLDPGYFWWMTPIVGALFLSVPISVYTSRVSLGDRARAFGLFLTPEEISPDRELLDLGRELDPENAEARRRRSIAGCDGFVRAVVDPVVNAVHCRLQRRSGAHSPPVRIRRNALCGRALADGPQALGAAERRDLLSDPDMMTALHDKIWQSEAGNRPASWIRGGE